MPMALAAPRARSSVTPRVKGPRSLMTTVTDCPLRGLVTVTRDPNGRVRCAAVWLPGLNVWPLAVRRPEAYQVATTCRPAHLPSGRAREKKHRKQRLAKPGAG